MIKIYEPCWWRIVIAFTCLGMAGLSLAQALDPEPTTPPKPTLKPVVRPAAAQPFVAPLNQNPSPNRTRPLPIQARPSGAALGPVNATPVTSATPNDALVWDSEMKELTADPGATNILVTFSFTNVHSSDIVIRNVRPSCGCTTVKLASLPWTIPSGSNGQITASLDLRGKYGVLTKSLMVDSTSGFKSLLFKVSVPTQITTTTATGQSIDSDRLKNMQLAQVDRQVVFKNQDCAKCHAEPAHGKMGEELFNAACAICHASANRATMVPDLHALKVPTNLIYWKYWIGNGRAGSLMPAFAQVHGGPLTNEQIESLAAFLNETITMKKPAGAAAASAVAAPKTPATQAKSAESISVFPAPASK